MAEQLDAERLRELLNTTDQVLAVELYTDWCPSCRSFERIFEGAAEEWTRQEKNVIFGKLNLEDAAEVAERYGVRSVPTVLMLHGGEVLARHTGLLGKAPLIELLRSGLKKLENR